MSKLLIKGGRVLDPGAGIDQVADVLIENGRVAAIKKSIKTSGAEVINAKGLMVCPGFIDIHVHLREPGREDKETIATGTRAAAAGGFTTVCPMPNTNPVIDSATGVNHVLAVAARDGVVHVLPVAAVTRGEQGKEITEFGDLAKAGAIGFSDDGRPVVNPEIMRRALEYTAMLNRPVMDHAELPELCERGVVHEGDVAARLGLRGIPASAETACVARDIELAAETGGHVHICHVSTARACELIADAKKRGVRVTAEVTPHHLTLTEAEVEGFDTKARVSPPLRSNKDRDALRKALKQGVIDCVATDHAPHTDIEKDQPFDQAPPGMIGLEFAFAQLYTELVLKNILSLEILIERLTAGPARVIHLDRGTLKAGSPADVTILDLNGETRVERGRFFSKSSNTPVLGKVFKGAVVETIVDGERVYSRGKILKEANAPTA